MNNEGQVKDLSLEDIPNFIREYLQNFAKPLTVKEPELAHAFQLFPVVDDLEAILEDDTLDIKLSLPLLFVLWTNLITRMARVETVATAQENYKILKEEEKNFVQQEENQEEEGGGKRLGEGSWSGPGCYETVGAEHAPSDGSSSGAEDS